MQDIPKKCDNLNLNKIAIHTCCADCFLNAVNYLAEKGRIKEDTEIVSLYFNPNIHPRTEFYARLDALKKVIEERKDLNIKLVVPDYKPKKYIEAVLKRESTISRCNVCWRLRLGCLFEYAKKNSIGIVTSTLLTSHYQDRDVIEGIVKEINVDYSLDFVSIDSSCNCKNFGFYKQNYCGCCFSLTEKLISK